MIRWEESSRLFERARESVSSGVSSAPRRTAQPVPLFAERAAGAYLYDVDGNRYVDYMMAYGPLIHGHGHPVIVHAIAEQAGKGTVLGVQHRGEIDLAELITRYVPCAERVSFQSTGTEAVQLAIRIARAFTGRTRILRFAGHYHGWSDSIFTALAFNESGEIDESQVRPGTGGQSKGALNEILQVAWNDVGILERTLSEHGRDVAAVIMEPVVCNSGCLQPRSGYLEAARELSKRHGALLIFDEVITGFRLGLGGAQERFGVTPDLCTLGKAAAGGLPLSVVAGRAEVMTVVENGTVGNQGNMNGNPLCAAAAIASIRLLAADDGALLQKAEASASRLADGLRELAARYEVPLVVNQAGPVFHTVFTREPEVADFAAYQRRDAAKCMRFVHAFLARGVLLRPSGIWYVSTVHSPDDIDETLATAASVFENLS